MAERLDLSTIDAALVTNPDAEYFEYTYQAGVPIDMVNRVIAEIQTTEEVE